MGISVQLQDENGVPIETLHDPTMILSRLLDCQDFSSTRCLGFIDPYGDTTFNRAQVDVLLSELAAIRDDTDAMTRAHLDDITGLAIKAQAEPHLYLKFIGD